MTCGEWVQGRIGGKDFLVSCPVGVYTTISLTYYRINADDLKIDGKRIDHDGVASYPEKAVRAVENVCNLLAIKGFGFKIEINCPKPVGKGFATSSADVLGSIMAVLKLFKVDLPPEKFFRLGIEIEPSDSLGYLGLWKINHRMKYKAERGAVEPCYLGREVPGKVMVLDLGGEVETLRFNENQHLGDLYRRNETPSKRAYDYVKRGIRTKNLALMAKGSTLSSISHQRILPKKELDCIVDSFESLGALGIVIAHSGTLVGFIYPSEKKDFDSFYSWHRKYGPGKIVGVFELKGGEVKMTGGGIYETL